MEGRSCGGGISTGQGIKILIADSDMDIPQKWCPQCRKYRPYSMFSNNRTRFDGLQSECKRCSQANSKAARLSAKNKLLADVDSEVTSRNC
jgi:hypothetical protein